MMAMAVSFEQGVTPRHLDLFLANAGASQASGSLMSAIKDACKSGMLDWSPRLMLAMYTCDIQASSKLSPYLR